MGAKTSKTLVIEDQNSEEFTVITEDMRRSGIKAARLNAIFIPLVLLMGTIATAIVIRQGGGMVLDNLLMLGTLSAFASYATGIFEPTSGRILIDGRDYRERSQLWLHSNIGYVLQSPHLFSGTVMENIRYGRLDATDEEVMEAARAVSAHLVVEKLENGWQSDVGEGGDRLSTGEKQLISFARAVLANPRIFVLDEATSSIDTQTEQLIQNAIEYLLKDRTSFLIAHRLSTIRQADLILVVRDGRIVEQGRHEELLRLGGYYHTLYSRQFEEESAMSILQR